MDEKWKRSRLWIRGKHTVGKKGIFENWGRQDSTLMLVRFSIPRNKAIGFSLCDVSLATRSQAVVRIADRTASQHLLESRDVIGHVTIWFPIGHFLLVVLWNQASISNGFWDIQWRMWHSGWRESRDLKRPLNKGQGHSFWYQSISRVRLRIGCQ